MGVRKMQAEDDLRLCLLLFLKKDLDGDPFSSPVTSGILCDYQVIFYVRVDLNVCSMTPVTDGVMLLSPLTRYLNGNNESVEQQYHQAIL